MFSSQAGANLIDEDLEKLEFNDENRGLTLFSYKIFFYYLKLDNIK